MLFNNSVLTNFVRSILFITLAGLSLSAAAYNHEKDEKKAKAKVENAMEKKEGMHEGMADKAKQKKYGEMDDEELTEAEKKLKEEADAAPEE